MKTFHQQTGSRLFLLALVLAGGCNRAEVSQTEPKTAKDVLDRMRAAYQKARTYADGGEARLAYTADGQHADEPFNFSVSFERPNKLRLNVYHCNMVSDGKLLQATIGDLPNQVLSVKAPAQLSVEDVYRDEVLMSALARQVAGGPLQLALLLVDNPLEPILAAGQAKLIEPAQHADGPCYRVQFDRDDGTLVFWIDRNSYVLRRIDLPVKQLYEEFSKQAKISDLSVVIDLKGARLDEPIDPVAFQFAVPEGSQLVDSFRVIPRPEPPSNLLGKQIPEFTFTTLDGKPVTRESLTGKVAVIDFWATWCGPCFQALPETEAIYQKYKDNSEVAFLAVSIDQQRQAGAASTGGDQPPASNDEVAQAFKAANLHLPIARDLKQFANISFGVQQIPNMFILGRDGKLQDHVLGFDPATIKELPTKIEKLLAGKDIFAEAQQRYQQRLREYDAQFQTPAPGQTAAADQPRGTIAPPSSPTHLKLTSLWRYEGLKDPGNVLVVTGEGGKPRILVNDGWNRVAELDASGKLVGSHELELPSEGGEPGIVSALRTAEDSDGKRYFVGLASSRQQLHVFDDQFKRLWSYPDGTSVGGISDVQVADLDGDGHPELNVAYYDVVGVQNVALDGKRRWANRSLANVLRLAITGANESGRRQVLCASQSGTLTPIDAGGRDSTPVDVNHRFVRAVYSAQLGSAQQTDYCGIAIVGKNQEMLIGFDLTGKELWSFLLPAGLQHHAALEMVASGNVLGAKTGQWIVAGADGSVHVVSADGVPVDHFECGQAISGVCVADFDGPALIVATSKGVEAFKVAEGAAADLSLKPER